MTEYLFHLIILFCLFAISGMGLNVVLGGVGLIHLGYVGLIEIGAYASAIVTMAYGWPMWLGVLLAVCVSGCVGAGLGYIAKFVRGDALGILLLGFHFAVYALALNWQSLTRGALGIPGIIRSESIRSNGAYAIFMVACAFIVFILATRLLRSPFGRVMGAIRDDALHAKTLGKRVVRVQVLAMGFSGMIAGLAGALQAHAIRFIDPASFFLPQLVLILSVVFLGGLASMEGTVIGALIATILPELIDQAFHLPASVVGAVRAMIFSAILILVVLYRPRGLLGRVELPNAYGEDE